MLYLQIDYGHTPAPTDNGTRPFTGTDTPIWDNASIWMTGDPGVVTQTSTHVGAPTDIRVRVTNTGDAAVDFVNVDAYLMNPFVGATYPAQAIATFGGSLPSVPPGSGGTSPQDAHVALCQLPTAPPSSWVPTQAQLDNSTDGHLCLVANVYAEGDGRQLGSGDPIDIVNNPHHGQRNIALLASTQKIQGLPIQVMPHLEGQPTLLDIHALDINTAIGQGETWLLRSRPNVVRIPLEGREPWFYVTGSHDQPHTAMTFSQKAIAGKIDFPGHGTIDLRQAAGATKAAVARVGNANEVDWNGAEGDGRIKLAATTEIQNATLSLERDDDKGSLQAFDIVQRTENGTIIGGLRVLSLVTGTIR